MMLHKYQFHGFFVLTVIILSSVTGFVNVSRFLSFTWFFISFVNVLSCGCEHILCTIRDQGGTRKDSK